MTLSEASGRTRLIALAVLVATFLGGAAAGLAFDRVVMAGEATASETTDEANDERRRRRGDLLEQLELTAEQRREVDSVLERRHAQVRAFWDEEGPRLRAIADSARADIRAILTAQQRAEYDRLLAERRAAKHKRGKNGGETKGR